MPWRGARYLLQLQGEGGACALPLPPRSSARPPRAPPPPSAAGQVSSYSTSSQPPAYDVFTPHQLVWKDPQTRRRGMGEEETRSGWPSRAPAKKPSNVEDTGTGKPSRQPRRALAVCGGNVAYAAGGGGASGCTALFGVRLGGGQPKARGPFSGCCSRVARGGGIRSSVHVSVALRPPQFLPPSRVALADRFPTAHARHRPGPAEAVVAVTLGAGHGAGWGVGSARARGFSALGGGGWGRCC